MRKSIIIGLTGPTGSGKSTVALAMEEAGCAVIDADQIARQVVKPGAPATKALADEFGAAILDDFGNLKRHTLANIAFSSPEKTRKLNEITHPFILKKMREEIEANRAVNKKIIALDAPLLFESGLDKICDVTLTVTAPREERARRIMGRDFITREEADRRMAAQQPEEYYAEKADYVIINQETSDELYYKIRMLIKRLKEELDDEGD